jgi:hypothetical protein
VSLQSGIFERGSTGLKHRVAGPENFGEPSRRHVADAADRTQREPGPQILVSHLVRIDPRATEGMERT